MVSAMFFKHYSKLTCENQEKEIFFSDLLASVFEIWQDGAGQLDNDLFMRSQIRNSGCGNGK